MSFLYHVLGIPRTIQEFAEQARKNGGQRVFVSVANERDIRIESSYTTLSLRYDSERVREQARKVADDLATRGFEVILDEAYNSTRFCRFD